MNLQELKELVDEAIEKGCKSDVVTVTVFYNEGRSKSSQDVDVYSDDDEFFCICGDSIYDEY